MTFIYSMKIGIYVNAGIRNRTKYFCVVPTIWTLLASSICTVVQCDADLLTAISHIALQTATYNCDLLVLIQHLHLLNY